LTWFEEWSIQHRDHLNTLTYAGGKWKDVFAKKAAPNSYRHETFLFRAEDLIHFIETCQKMCPKVSFRAKKEWYARYEANDLFPHGVQASAFVFHYKGTALFRSLDYIHGKKGQGKDDPMANGTCWYRTAALRNFCGVDCSNLV